jgi:hypothetical protein
MNNVSRQTRRTVLAAAGPFVWSISRNPLLCLRIERNSLDQDTVVGRQLIARTKVSRENKGVRNASGTH